MALLISSVVLIIGFTVHHVSASGKKTDETETRLASDRPAAATAEPRKLDMPAAPAASAAAPVTPRVPALVVTPGETADEMVEPIGVRRTGAGTPASGDPRSLPPEDAPILLVSTRPGTFATHTGTASGRNSTTPAPGDTDPMGAEQVAVVDPISATARNLEGYQRQLQGVLDNLTQSAALATGQASGPMPSGPAAATGAPGALLGTPPLAGPAPGGPLAAGIGLFGGQLQGSPTPKVAASTLGNRSLTLPKGTAFTCALKTKVISATSGLVGCQVQRNVYSDNGRVLLIERGSHLDGEYRVTSVRPGMVRIPVLWTRIRTPLGVTVDIESPGTGPLGESGIAGHVDNRWGERIGAALLLSLIDDSVNLVIQSQASERQADTIVLQSTTDNTSKLAEKVLDSTINIPPLIYQNQGGIVGIYVARDVDFSSVYELQPTTISLPHGGTQ